MATKPHGTAYLTFYSEYATPENIAGRPRVETLQLKTDGHNRISLKKIANQQITAFGYTPLERWKKCRSSDWRAETHTRRLNKGRLVSLAFWHK